MGKALVNAKSVKDNSYDLLSKITYGLFSKMDCNYLKITQAKLEQVYCTYFVPSVSSIFILCYVIAFFSCVQIINFIIMNKRFPRDIKTIDTLNSTQKPLFSVSGGDFKSNNINGKNNEFKKSFLNSQSKEYI